MSIPPLAKSLAPVPKIKAAAAVGGIYAAGVLLALWAGGGLTLKAGILAVTGPLLPVVGGYLKSS